MPKRRRSRRLRSQSPSSDRSGSPDAITTELELVRKQLAEVRQQKIAVEAELEGVKQQVLDAEECVEQAKEDIDLQFRDQLNSIQRKVYDVQRQLLNEQDRADAEAESAKTARDQLTTARETEARVIAELRGTQDQLRAAQEQARISNELEGKAVSEMERALLSNQERDEQIAKLNEEIRRCKDSELYYRSIASSGSGSSGSSAGTAQSINIPLPRQSEYTGNTSWEGFIKPFKGLAEACGWTDDEKRFRLVSSLRDEAATYAFSELSEETLQSFNSLERALESRFGERLQANAFSSMLETRRMGAKESLTDFTADIRRLVTRGYPTADEETREAIALRYFLKGLNDQQMALTVGMKDPKSLEEARSAAETYLALRDETGKGSLTKIRSVQPESTQMEEAENISEKEETSSHASGESMMAGLLRQLEALLQDTENKRRQQPRREKRYQANRREYNRPTNNKASVVCYGCGEEGHYARECRKRKQDVNPPQEEPKVNNEQQEN